MTLNVIVQARAASSRIPLKMLESLGGRSAFLRCLDRCRQIDGVGLVVAAIADGEDNDEIAEETADNGYLVTRGPETDVLERISRAARESQAETIIRIMGHHPFIDPDICSRVVNLYADTYADFACNNMPMAFPDGLQCEVFSAELLARADVEATHPDDRESVTDWMRMAADLRRVAVTGPGNGFERLRWALEEPEDLDFCAAVYAELGERAATVGATELAALCLRRPDITGLNAKLAKPVRTTGAPEFATPAMAFSRAA